MRKGSLREVTVLSGRIICLANIYRPWERECLDVTPDSCANWGAYSSAPQGPWGWLHLSRRPARGGTGTGRARGAGRDTGADSVSLTGMFIQARGQRHRSTSTRDPTFPQQSQAGVPSVESWLMMTMSRSGAGSFQGFTSFISTPDFINDVGHQPRSYPNLLVSLGIVGFHGDPNFLNKTLKHLGQGPDATVCFIL